MSEQKKNRSKIVLAVIVIIALIGACFGSVGLYVKNDLSKPKFTLPETAQSVTPLPESQSGVYSYVALLCERVAAADNIEESFRTEISEIDSLVSPFSDSDNAVIKYIINSALGTLNGLYTSVDNVKAAMLENAPELIWREDLLTDFSAVQGGYSDTGEYVDDSYYFINLSFDPAENKYDSVLSDKIIELFSPAFSVEGLEVETLALDASYKIDRFTDQLVSIDIVREYTVSVSVVLSEQYSALLPEGESSPVRVTLPYKTTERLSFSYYGAYFTKPAIAVNKGDVETLPASVTVNSDAGKDDYDLTFTVSVPGAVEIDEDGVMTVLKDSDESVTVTMTLVYEGRTYTDNLTVYITELEVETDG